MDIVIIDTCSIIKLGKGNILGYLNILFDEIIIPEAVIIECNRHEITKSFLLNFKFTIVKVNTLLDINLDFGEKECISYAVEKEITNIITDDDKAIKKAVLYNLSPITTFDILILLKNFNLIPSAKNILDMIISKNEGISQENYDKVLIECDEIKN